MVQPAPNVSFRERFNISRLAIQYPWLTLGFWLAVCALGVVGFNTLKYNLFPDITFPVVVVNIQAPFKTSLDTEKLLTRPLEERLKSLKGVTKVRSSTYPGQATVSLAFDVGTDLEAASNAVEAQVKALAVQHAQIIPLNLNESAAVSYALQSSKQDLTALAKQARTEMLPAIAQLPGVLKVTLLGEPATPSLTAPAAAVRFNGRGVLAFQVVKRGDANTLEVVSRVEKEVERLRTKFPEVRLDLAATQATYIREATTATIEALALAIALSILVIYPFLWNWQATVISALAIPTSLLGTFIVMAVYGFNLETITLLALALVIGIIVDDAIVDVENIARHLEEGEPPLQAAISATNEIGLTVTATTLTIVAVFLPVGLMGGVLGQFFRPFGITISAAVITSLLVARTLSPLLAVHWLKPAPARLESGAWNNFVARYRALLAWALMHRGTVLGLALLSFGGGLGLIPLISKGFIPHLDRGEFNVVYQAPPTVSLEQSLTLARELEAVVRRAPEVESVFTTVGSRQGQPNRGLLYVKLRHDRTLTTSAQQNQLRAQLPKFPGVLTSVEDIQFVDNGGEKPLQFALLGEDLTTLDKATRDLKAQVQKLPGFVDVTATGDNGLGGIEIEHLNGKRVAYISANLGSGLTLGAATDRVVAEAKTLLPPTVKLDLGGDSERAADTFSGFGVTLGLAVLCVLAVLLLLFRSWVDPLVIILSLPLSIVGAMLAQFVTRSDFGMISVIGIIFLLGLVNKNAILLVDYINQLRASGLSRSEAILRAGPVRLRPILMTTAATVLGMLPIALGLGAGAELRAPMAIVIIGGLLASTLLSLIVVPVAYALFDEVRVSIAKRGG
ncbi:efflux RND transporter permease subunit [Anthocerotibacter panamensis]|uniref:efflux RND transporter permease subunit n=1 Tax=Anthocerotibacter panamensis TaxID=2857077 RepID=UPI001C402654|nr:efflux RND transporter permease subunit [Anthocerotibacter panamensis]